MRTRVYYKLLIPLDQKGKFREFHTCERVVKPDSTFNEICEAIQSAWRNFLEGTTAPLFRVYANKSNFSEDVDRLRLTNQIGQAGSNKDEPLIVVANCVPRTRSQAIQGEATLILSNSVSPPPKRGKLTHTIESFGESDDTPVIVTVPQQEEAPDTPVSPASQNGGLTETAQASLTINIGRDDATTIPVAAPLADHLHVVPPLASGPQPFIDDEDSASGTQSDALMVVPRIQCTPALLTLTPGNGIEFGRPYLKRTDIIRQIQSKFKETRILLLWAPPASGKTSLLQLLSAEKNHSVVYVSFAGPGCPFSLLEQKKIDYLKETWGLRTSERVIVAIDDAQDKYENKEFWRKFIKDIGKAWIPQNVYLLIAATHKLNSSVDSLAEFSQLERLGSNVFLLKREEYDALVEKFKDLPSTWYERFGQLFELIWNDSKGHIGSICCSLKAIVDHFTSRDSGHTRARDAHESEVIQYYMSANLLTGLERCFGSFPSSLRIVDELRITLLQCVYTPTKPDSASTNEYFETSDFVKRLKKCGLLKSEDFTLEFTSPLARRYTLAYLFPDRSWESPTSLHELVVRTLAVLSPDALSASRKIGKFPVEHVFQAFMLKSFIQLTAGDVRVVPELSESFSGEPKRIPGRVDLYLNGNLRWGVELLVCGRQVEEHLDRFGQTGKYAALEVKDYVVIDLRPSDNHEISFKNEHLATVIFNESLRECSLFYGLKETADQIMMGKSLADARNIYT